MTDKYEGLGFDMNSKKYADAIFALEKAGFKENEILQLKNGKKKNGWFSFELPNGNTFKIEQKTCKIENSLELKKIHLVLNRDKLLKERTRLKEALISKFRSIAIFDDESRKIANSLHYTHDYKMAASCYGYILSGRVLACLFEPGEELPQSVVDQLNIKWVADWAFDKAKMHKENWKNYDLRYIDSAKISSISTYTDKDGIVHVHIHEMLSVTNKKTDKELQCHLRILGRYHKDNDTWSKELEESLENNFYRCRLLDDILVTDVISDFQTLDLLRDRYILNIQKALHEITVDDLKQIRNADNDINTIIYLLGGCNIRGKGNRFSNDYLKRVPGQHIIFTGVYMGMPYRYNFQIGTIYLSDDEKHSIPLGKYMFIKKLVREWKKSNEALPESKENFKYNMYMLDNKDGLYRGKLVLCNEYDKIVDEIEVVSPVKKTRKDY